MPVTERVVIPVTGDVENWKEGLKLMLQTLKTQPGYLRTRWGPISEDESKLELLIGWESTEAQQAFLASADFGTAMSQLKPVLAGKPSIYFLQLVPYAPKEVIDASIVQLITITNPTASVDSFRSQIEQFKLLPGCTGATSGSALSAIDGKGTPLVAVIGWESLAASQEGRHKVKVEAGGELEEHHVNFRYPVKGFRGL